MRREAFRGENGVDDTPNYQGIFPFSLDIIPYFYFLCKS